MRQYFVTMKNAYTGAGNGMLPAGHATMIGPREVFPVFPVPARG
ncbi:hypothetical protein Misp01_72170 [Microtetraspora sp. NBRC 13810]|nr:hypothetical protein Misp01_72170 [Microtetraspora sp. NBRC 13810]